MPDILYPVLFVAFFSAIICGPGLVRDLRRRFHRPKLDENGHCERCD